MNVIVLELSRKIGLKMSLQNENKYLYLTYRNMFVAWHISLLLKKL